MILVIGPTFYVKLQCNSTIIATWLNSRTDQFKVLFTTMYVVCFEFLLHYGAVDLLSILRFRSNNRSMVESLGHNIDEYDFIHAQKILQGNIAADAVIRNAITMREW